MNCCDEYGNCRQGRDCPIRAERIERIRKLGEEHRNRDKIFEVLAPLVLTALILLAIWVGSLYHQAIKATS